MSVNSGCRTLGKKANPAKQVGYRAETSAGGELKRAVDHTVHALGD